VLVEVRVGGDCAESVEEGQDVHVAGVVCLEFAHTRLECLGG
jgi:hypothetical protein